MDTLSRYFGWAVLCVLLTFGHNNAWAQHKNQFPQLGQLCPDFQFNELHYHARTKATRDDFKGKYLVLDFWNRYCTACLNSMPKMDSLNMAFSDSVAVVMVGYTGSRYSKRSDNSWIRKLYEDNRKEQNLNLPIAYDSVLFHRFNIGACPYIIVLDKQSKVMAITTSINAKQLEELLKGNAPVLQKAYRRDERF